MKHKDVARMVRELREQMGLTQEQFARVVGVTYATVNYWENGRRSPQPFLLQRLEQLQDELHAGGATHTGSEGMGGAGDTFSRGRAVKRDGSLDESAIGEAIREMVRRIRERFHPVKVILFGSHARGDATPNSDVDLLVILDFDGSKRETQLQVRRLLHDIRIPKDIIVSRPQEFSRRQQVVGTIERQAVREGKVQYEAG